ncbi:MAG: hypothetical protein ACRC42_01065 [Mycoplasma sp.]
MRINFEPIQPEDKEYLKKITEHYDLISDTFPSFVFPYDNLSIYNVKSYTDYSKYLLNVYKVHVERMYANKTSVTTNLKTQSDIQVFEIEFNFNLDTEFKLFSKKFINIWPNDTDIDIVRPVTIPLRASSLSHLIFKSSATSYFAKMARHLTTNNMTCVKKDNRLIFAYSVDDQDDFYKRDDLLELFLKAVYEIVTIASVRESVKIPDDIFYEKYDIEEHYNNRRRTKNRRPTEVMFVSRLEK